MFIELKSRIIKFQIPLLIHLTIKHNYYYKIGTIVSCINIS